MLHEAQVVLTCLHCIMGHCKKPELLETSKIDDEAELFTSLHCQHVVVVWELQRFPSVSVTQVFSPERKEEFR